MTTIKCADEKLALNLNPFQIFIFVNEKTKPYLDQIKNFHSEDFHIELITFDAAKDGQAVVGEDVDPMLYYNITHADIFARLMPVRADSYVYGSEILFQGKDYGDGKFLDVIRNFYRSLAGYKRRGIVNTLRLYFQYGHEEFYDFLMEVYKGNLSKLLEMSNFYTHIVSSSKLNAAEKFLSNFMRQLSKDKKEEMISIIKETLGFANEKDSRLLLCSYLKYKYTPGSGGFSKLSVGSPDKKVLQTPDFSIVIEYRKKEKLSGKEGDYAILLRKDDGNQIELEFSHRGDKMLYLLTLLCQKARGGLPTLYFKNNQAKEVIKNIYDKVYRSGGDEWVEKCSENSHTISTYRSHAKGVIEHDERLESYMSYWCNFENQNIYVGSRRFFRPLEIRKIRLPEDRIEIYDGNDDRESFADILRALPQLTELYDINKENYPELFKIQENLLGRVRPREDNRLPFKE